MNKHLKIWTIAILSGILFFILSAPFTYKATDFVTTKIGFDTIDINEKPTWAGLALHSVVFIIISGLAMYLKICN
jgi:hypothetical protein